jgi:hypothetical protein
MTKGIRPNDLRGAVLRAAFGLRISAFFRHWVFRHSSLTSLARAAKWRCPTNTPAGVASASPTSSGVAGLSAVACPNSTISVASSGCPLRRYRLTNRHPSNIGETTLWVPRAMAKAPPSIWTETPWCRCRLSWHRWTTPGRSCGAVSRRCHPVDPKANPALAGAV